MRCLHGRLHSSSVHVLLFFDLADQSMQVFPCQLHAAVSAKSVLLPDCSTAVNLQPDPLRVVVCCQLLSISRCCPQPVVSQPCSFTRGAGRQLLWVLLVHVLQWLVVFTVLHASCP